MSSITIEVNEIKVTVSGDLGLTELRQAALITIACFKAGEFAIIPSQRNSQ